jgi:N-acetylglucosamine-6-phosphate deacetylase
MKLKILLLFRVLFFLIFYCTIVSEVTGQTITTVRGLLYSDLKPVEIEIKDGKIFKIVRIKSNESSTQPLSYIAPGLFDNQVNGYAGVSFTFGGGELDMNGIKKATEALWKEGVTTFLPTLTTNSHQVLIKNFEILSKAVNEASLRGSIPGFHLEGPYISPVDGFRGAHPKQHVRNPDWSEFEQLYTASGKKILEITLAPELDGAMDFISKCSKLGVVVALGHHNGNKDQIDKAVTLGAKISTHLGNGCANMINRHVNPLWPQLANDNLMASIICDGFHLRPEEISVFYKVKGPGNTIITSDVTHFAGMSPGKYTNSDGETIELTPEGMLRLVDQNVLYGSASPITKGVGNMMKVTGCTLGDAIKMASSNPAELYKLNDRGKIEPGKRADLIIFSIEDNKLKILKTIVKGETVFEQ